MTKKELINKYGKYNYKSIVDAVNDYLMVLYYSKKIPRYKIRKKEWVDFDLDDKVLTIEIIKLFNMKEREIISLIETAKKGSKGYVVRQL